VDVRTIAATNKDLEEEIAAGRFREDLFFRLSVIPIHSPPLRERTDDIPTLVNHFIENLASEDNLKKKKIAPEAMDRLKKHHWKGNIRELRNTIERLVIMSPGDVIQVTDLPEAVRSTSGVVAPDSGQAGTLKEFKELSERSFLVSKLRENNWNISQTAQVIGTPRSNLYKKLEQYKITQEIDG
jgi:two-component system nitrogen regulation response regulator NtrX